MELNVKPNPGVGFRLIEPGETLRGSFLFFSGNLWDTAPQRSDVVYTEEATSKGLYYRKQHEDPEKAFNDWFLRFRDNTLRGDEWSLRMAWNAAKTHYSKC